MSTSGFAGFCHKTSGYGFAGFGLKTGKYGGWCTGAIAEFASRLSEVIDGQMDFRTAQDGLDTSTPRF